MKIKEFVAKNWKKLLVVVIVLISIIYFVFGRKTNISKTDTVKKGSLSEELVLSGEITAKNYAKLYFETPGKINYVGVSDGDKVYKGKLLSKLDTTVLNSSYQIALSNLRAAEATVSNIHDQVKDHSGDETFAQKDLRTTAEVAKDKAYESTIIAKRNLDGASIYAPFNGIVTKVYNPYSGVYVNAQTPQIEILDPETMYFSATVDQSDITSIVDKTDCVVVFDSYPDEKYPAKIDNISFAPKAGESGIVYEVRINLNDLKTVSKKLRIGMTADATIVLKNKDNILYVPQQYVREDIKGKYILVGKKDNKVYVKTGIESDKGVEVEGDIKEGDQVLSI